MQMQQNDTHTRCGEGEVSKASGAAPAQPDEQSAATMRVRVRRAGVLALERLRQSLEISDDVAAVIAMYDLDHTAATA